MSTPEEPTPGPAHAHAHAVHAAHTLRRHSGPPVPGRWAALVVVVAIVAGVGLFEVAAPAPGAAPPPAGTAAIGLAPAASVTSSAFCTAGSGSSVATTIYLTNTTAHAVTGSMSTVGADAGGPVPQTRRTVTVPPLGTSAVNPSLGLPAGSTATSFSFAGGGVSADQVVAGPNGWSTAPCASETSDQWALAGGSTTAGSSLTLALYNPAAPTAVVDVSFLTPKGLVTPQAYQGLSIPPGQLVDENVGDYVQDATPIATFVTAVSGSVVADTLAQTTGAVNGIALSLGSPGTPATTWRFAHVISLRGSTVAFDIANPGATAVSATISAGMTGGSVVPKTVSVAPQSVGVFDASTAWAPGVSYSVTVSATGPVAVARSVAAPAGATPPTWGGSAGSSLEATRWLVPGPGVPGAPGVAGATVESLAVADPSSVPAQVVVGVLGGRILASLTVEPGTVRLLGPGAVGGLRVLTVSSSQPVVVEEDSGPSGAPGVVSSTGFPLSG